MLKNKKILIILISIFLALVIGVSTVLIIAVSVPSDKSEDTNQAETDNTTTVQEFSIEIDGTKYLSGTTNDIYLTVGNLYNFNISGVNNHNDYDFEVVPYLPSENYEFYIFVSISAIFKTGNNLPSSIDDGRDVIWSFSALKDLSSGFSFLSQSKCLQFLMSYYDLRSFFENYFEPYDVSIPQNDEYFDLLAVEQFLITHLFKLNIRKIDTDELISFVLYFRE